MSKAIRFTFPRFAVFIFCLVFLFTLLLGFTFQRRFLLEPFASTQATVTATESWNHGRLYYSYVVGGNTFTGVGSGSVQPGAQMKVFYLLSDPAVSTDYDSSGGFAGLFGTALFSGLFMAGGGCLMIYCYARYVLATRSHHPTA